MRQSIYAKQFVTKIRSSNPNQFCDYLLIEIPGLLLIMGVVYKPPNCPKDKFISQMTNINDKVNDFQKHKNVNYNFLLMGDYNFPFIKDWNQSNCFTNSHDDEKAQSVCLSKFTEEHLLMQMVDAPTRGKNTLDLIFSNSEELVTDSKVIVNKKISDHNSVIFNLGLKNNNDLRPIPIDEDIQSFNAFDFVNASAETCMKSKQKLDNINWKL